MPLRRCGAGSMPCSFKIRAIVDRLTVWRRFANAPWMRPYPQETFSLAMRTTSSWIVSFTRGLPGPRLALPSYFLAIRLRYHRRMVSGVTIVQISFSTLRPKALPLAARRRRGSSVTNPLSAELLTKHPVLLGKVFDHVLLLQVDPAGQHDQQELPCL